jgi:hypothetical protein
VEGKHEDGGHRRCSLEQGRHAERRLTGVDNGSVAGSDKKQGRASYRCLCEGKMGLVRGVSARCSSGIGVMAGARAAAEAGRPASSGSMARTWC